MDSNKAQWNLVYNCKQFCQYPKRNIEHSVGWNIKRTPLRASENSIVSSPQRSHSTNLSLPNKPPFITKGRVTKEIVDHLLVISVVEQTRHKTQQKGQSKPSEQTPTSYDFSVPRPTLSLFGSDFEMIEIAFSHSISILILWNLTLENVDFNHLKIIPKYILNHFSLVSL